jgi:enterobacterial common antigen flippase
VTASGKSYRDILRSSSIMGGAQVVTYLVALLRVKLVAILLGPAGVGLVSVYSSATSLLGTIAGLGIANSAVREIARANGSDDQDQSARTTAILERAGWMTGVVGLLLAVGLAQPMSVWMLGSPAHTWALATLGVCVLLNLVNVARLALLQGYRRVGDIARANVLSAVLGTVAAIGLYAALGQDGIVPSLIATSLLTLVISSHFCRASGAPTRSVSWRETLSGTQALSRLGAAFVWSGLLVASVDVFTRSVIARALGLDAAGMYQAAWALSGLFASFILTAMSADFYPRLTAVIVDHPEAARVVNQQTEVGILLAVPGLLASICFAHVALHVFYAPVFAPAADVLRVLVVGVFCRVISWPMGFVQLSLGASRSFIVTESLFVAVQAALVYVLVPHLGVLGAAYAFTTAYMLYVMCMLFVSRALIGFRWSSEVVRMIAISAALMVGSLMVGQMHHGIMATVVATALVGAGTVWSVLGLAQRTHSPVAQKVRGVLQSLRLSNYIK